MKAMIEETKKMMKRVANHYMDLMRIYGEALLRGGSYGWA